MLVNEEFWTVIAYVENKCVVLSVLMCQRPVSWRHGAVVGGNFPYGNK